MLNTMSEKYKTKFFIVLSAAQMVAFLFLFFRYYAATNQDTLLEYLNFQKTSQSPVISRSLSNVPKHLTAIDTQYLTALESQLQSLSKLPRIIFFDGGANRGD